MADIRAHIEALNEDIATRAAEGRDRSDLIAMRNELQRELLASPEIPVLCTSTMNGVQCVRNAGHPVGANVWRDPDNTHWSKLGAVHWTDAAADPEPHGSEAGEC